MPLEGTVKRVVNACGGPARLAEFLGLKNRANVYRWTRIPEQYVDDCARRSGIPVRQIRPDLFNERGERLL